MIPTGYRHAITTWPSPQPPRAVQPGHGCALPIGIKNQPQKPRENQGGENDRGRTVRMLKVRLADPVESPSVSLARGLSARPHRLLYEIRAERVAVMPHQRLQGLRHCLPFLQRDPAALIRAVFAATVVVISEPPWHPTVLTSDAHLTGGVMTGRAVPHARVLNEDRAGGRSALHLTRDRGCQTNKHQRQSKFSHDVSKWPQIAQSSCD